MSRKSGYRFSEKDMRPRKKLELAKETAMRAFILGVIAAAVLATTASYALNAFQETAAQAMTTGSARLDQQEAVNRLGREG
jgi:hypothetical protein